MKTILCYGDSNTYGFDPMNGLRYSKEIRWTGRLQSMLNHETANGQLEECLVIEEGCNGRTTIFEDPIEGWKRGLDYLRPCLNTHKPVDVVILMLGTNDLKELFRADASQIAAGAQTLVRVIKEFTKEKQGFEPRIILVSPPCIGESVTRSAFSSSFGKRSAEESKKLAEYYRKVAEAENCLFYNAAEDIVPSETDGVHLSSEGHRLLAERLFEAVKKTFYKM